MSFGTYVCGIVSLTAAASLIGLLLPQENKGEHTLRTVLSLLLLCALISPCTELIRRAEEGLREGRYALPEAQTAGDGALYDALARQSRAEIGELLTDRICAAFGLSDREVRVTVSVSADGDGVRLEGVTAELTGRGVAVAPEDVRELIEDLCGCPCEIVTGRRRE